MNTLTQHELDCDILVAGGGLAGVSAALAAARYGARVILCQDRPVLGGNASSEVQMHMVGADASGDRGLPLQTEAREGGIIEEIRLENCVRNAQRSASMFDLILYEKCRFEPNLTLLLNTAVTGALVDGGIITKVIAERQSTEDRFTIAARIFIDCTGDGRLGLEAGAEFRQGRETRDEYNESLGQDIADNKRLGSTLLFRAHQHDHPMPFTAPPWAHRFTEKDLRLRSHNTNSDMGLEYGYWWVEWGGCLDTIKDNETIRDELLAIMLGVWDHVKNGGDHGAENWALDWFGFIPGKRESRRFIGLHVLSESDVMGSKVFDDAIAYGGWSVDIHPPEGVDGPDLPPCIQHEVPLLYDIPLRSCISGNVGNLMFAGRNMSATHVAFASIRVMATCGVVGQGVGTAAAYAARQGLLPAGLISDHEAMHTIRQRLLRDDAFLIGLVNADPNDLARSATITASSRQADGPADNVISGQTRSVHGKNGAACDRARPQTHRWMSDPEKALPAWIELRWPQPVTPTSVQIIFDTGMHRVLTMSQSDGYTQKMVWGRPQDETALDYTIEGLSGDKWRQLVKVEGNYQRRRVHPLDGKALEAIRITITATNDLDHARICEVRIASEKQSW